MSMLNPYPPAPSRFIKPLTLNEIARKSIKENYDTLHKYLGEPNWDSRTEFQFGVGCKEDGVYEHYVWLIDNIFVSAAIQYLRAQFERGYTPKPLF